MPRDNLPTEQASRCRQRSFLVAGFLLSLGALPPPVAAGQAQPEYADEWLAQPVDDATFAAYLEAFVYDPSVPFETQVVQEPIVDGISTQHLRFQSTPGVQVFARLYRVAGATPETPTLIVLHGGAARGKDSGAVHSLARLFVGHGFNVFAMDLLYFGERAAGVLEPFAAGDKRDRLYNAPSTYLDWVTQTVKDVGRSWDLLVKQRGAHPARIGLVGFSRGAVVSAIVGAAQRRLAAVVMIQGGHASSASNRHLGAACPANYIGRISPRPLLMINGERDAAFPKNSSVLPLQRLANPPKLLHWSDSVHGELAKGDAQLLVDWLRQHLMKSAGP